MQENHETAKDYSIKLFAAIFLEGELGGTPLQGLDFGLVSNHFISFLKQLSEEELAKYYLKSSTRDKILKSLEQINKTYYVTIASKLYSSEVVHEEIASLAEFIFQLLKKEKDVFFPGGFSSESQGGHSIVYRLMEKDGDIIFLSFDTGGSDYHHKIAYQSLSKIEAKQYRYGFNPVFAIKFSDREKIEQFGGLQAWIKTLLEPQMLPWHDHNYRDNNRDSIYKKIFQLSAYLGGEVVDPTPYYKAITAGQRDGTCTYQSIKKMLRGFFTKNIHFDLFILRHRLFVLRDVLHHQKIEKTYKKEFYAAIENTARSLDEGKKLEKKISLAKKRELLNELQEIKKEALLYFTGIEKEENKPIIKESLPAAKIIITPPLWLPSVQEDKSQELSITTLFPPSLLLFNKEDSLHEALKKLDGESQRADKRIFIYNIEQLCFHFCEKLKDFKSHPFRETDASLEIESWLEVITQIHQYSIDYFTYYFNETEQKDLLYYRHYFKKEKKVAQKQNLPEEKSSSPRNQLIALALTALLHYATIRLHAKILNHEEWHGDLNLIDNYIAYMPSWLVLSCMHKDFFISSIDPDISHLFTNLNTYYEDKKTISFKRSLEKHATHLLDHYKLLFASDYAKDEREQLEDFFKRHLNEFKKDSIKENLRALYLVCNQRKFLKEKSTISLSKLAPLVKAQKHINLCIYYCVMRIIKGRGKAYGRGTLGVHDDFLLDSMTINRCHKPLYEIPLQTLELGNDFVYYNNTQHKATLQAISQKNDVKQEVMEVLMDDANKNNHLNSNSIRLLNKTLLEKELRLLRLALPLQAGQVMDYFQLRMFLLKDYDYQLYMLFSLFQPGVLDTALKHQTDILSALFSLYREGIALDDLAKNKKKLSHRGLFLLKILSFTYGYLLYSPAASVEIQQTARKSYEKLDKEIKYWTDCHTEEPMQTELQRLSFYTLMKCYTIEELSQPEHELECERLLYALFYIKAHPKERIAGTITKTEDESFENLPLLLSTIKAKALTKAILHIIEKFLPERAPFSLAPNFTLDQKFNPIVHLLDNQNQLLSINLLRGIIYQCSQELVFIPKWLIENQPAYKAILGTDTPLLARQINSEEYQFDWEGESYYLSSKGFFKHINEVWYGYNNNSVLPSFLANKNYYAWISPTGDHALFLQKEAVLLYEWKEQTLFSAQPKGRICLDGDARASILTAFSALEHPSLIEVIHLDPMADQLYQFNLRRYGLVGFFNEKTAEFTLEYAQQTFYLNHHRSPLDLGVMISKAKDSSPQECLWLVPIQPFYRENEIIGAHYRLIHDTIQQLNEKDEAQHLAMFCCDQFGKWGPQDPYTSQQLYLIYLYCARYEFDKAHQLLERYLFQGTTEELTYIYWLCQHLAGDRATPYAITHPKLLAIQLRSLILLTRFPTFPSSKNKNLETFLDKIGNHIITIYEHYHRVSNHLSEEQKIPQPDLDYLAYWTELFLEKKQTLLQDRSAMRSYEKKQTESYLAFVHAKTPFFPTEKNKKVIFQQNSTLYKEKSIFPRWPTFAKEPPKGEGMGTLADLKALEKNDSLTASYQQACEQLSLDIPNTTLLKNLVYYFALIYDKEEKHTRYREILKDFCQRTLIAFNEIDMLDNQQDRLKVALILLHGLEAPDKFRKLYDTVFEQNSYSWNIDKLPTLSIWEIIKKGEELNTFSTVEVPSLKYRGSSSVVTKTLFRKVPPSHSSQAPSLLDTQEKTLPVKIVSGGELPISFLIITETLRELYNAMQAQKKEKIQQHKSLTFTEQRAQYNQTDQALDDIQNHYFKQIKTLIKEKIDLKKQYEDIKHHLGRLTIEIIEQRQALMRVTSFLPLDLQNSLLVETKRLGAVQLPIDLDALMIKYALGLDKSFLKKRRFSTETILQLNNSLKKYLRLMFFYRQYKRILETMANLRKKKEIYEQEEQQLQLAKQLLELDPLPGNPALDLFQYYTQKTVRTEQWELIDSILPKGNPKDCARQLMMGGGKSKIVLPQIAFLLANGKWLVVLEVPSALLTTTYLDIRRTAKEIFNQEVELFEFDRHSPCDAISLQLYFIKFKQIIQQRKCLIISPESLQSLHLKWRESLYQGLYSSPEEKVVLYEVIDLLRDNLQLFKKQGYGVIDEIQHTLDINHELNYSLDIPFPLPASIIKTTLHLFKFLETVVIKADNQPILEKLNGKTFKDLLHDPELLANPPEIMEALMAYYAKSYLPPSCNPSEQKKQMDLIEAQWNTFLPLTLKGKMYEHFGPAEDKNIKIAVPFAGNNTPTHNFFGNFIETVNYTIQATKIEGVPFLSFKQLLKSWKKIDQEHSMIETNSLSEVELRYEKCLAAIPEEANLPKKLQDIDISDEEQLKNLHPYLKKHPEFTDFALEEIILPSVLIYPKKLASNAINHVSQFAHVCGWGATLNNYPSFHDRISFDESSSFGTKYYLKNLLRTKQTSFLIQGEEQDKLLTQSALIDCGAHSRGKSNRKVAEELALLFKEKKPEICFVLFFENNQLWAWKVGGTENDRVLLPSTDAKIIEEYLKIKPNQRFTYYDQNHKEAIDILQDPDAEAFVTVDINTTLSDFLQASMRMRQLHANQKITIILSPALKAKLGDSPTLDALYQSMEEVEEANLEEDVFKSAYKKLYDVVQEDLDQRLMALDAKKAIRLFTKCHHLLIENNPVDVSDFCLKEEDKRVILEKIKEKLLAELAGLNVVTDEILQQYRKKCENIISKASSFFKKNKKSSIGLGTEINMEQKVNINVSLKQNSEIQEVNPNLSPCPINTQWIESCSFKNAYLDNEKNIQQFALLWGNNPKNAEDFSSTVWSNDLFISNNFYRTHTQQNPKVLAEDFIKPTLSVLFWQSGDGVKALLVCQEEAEVFAKRLSQNDDFGDPGCSMWLETPTGLSLAGKKPTYLNANYEIIKEQILTYNGDIKILAMKKDFFWLSKHQLSLLHKQILHHERNDELTLLEQLKKRLSGELSTSPQIQQPVFLEDNEISDDKEESSQESKEDSSVQDKIAEEFEESGEIFDKTTDDKTENKKDKGISLQQHIPNSNIDYKKIKKHMTRAIEEGIAATISVTKHKIARFLHKKLEQTTDLASLAIILYDIERVFSHGRNLFIRRDWRGGCLALPRSYKAAQPHLQKSRSLLQKEFTNSDQRLLRVEEVIFDQGNQQYKSSYHTYKFFADKLNSFSLSDIQNNDPPINIELHPH